MIFVILIFLQFSLQPLFADVALIYNGPGACSENCVSSAALMARNAGLSVRYINPKNWNVSLLNEASVYIQPGGESLVVASAMGFSQKQDLRNFVKQGGGYVGFCAGGFFATEKRKKTDSDDFENVEYLGLVPAFSALYTQATKGADVFLFLWKNLQAHLYWEEGPHFVLNADSDPNVETMAYYPTGERAGLQTQYGTGRVSIVGPHPEAPMSWRSYYRLADPDGLDYKYAEEMINYGKKPAYIN